MENVQRTSDQGTYSCTARNKQNYTAQRSVDIRVLGKFSRNYWTYDDDYDDYDDYDDDYDNDDDDDDDNDVDEIRSIGGGNMIKLLRVYNKIYFPRDIRQLNCNSFMFRLRKLLS